jgi:FtsP/CotA-like multicopper oxidase with cupredoxin domain
MVHAGFPTVYESSNGFLEATLRVEVATVALKFKNISFQTRTYNGMVPGPIFRVRPGDRVRILLSNQLDSNAPKLNCSGPEASFRAANSTNLHIHGIYAGIDEDNTAVCINPGDDLQYEYLLDSRTGTSTLFYHPHLDGSTAIQMYGGMAGAFEIVDPEQERQWFSRAGQNVFAPESQILLFQLLDFDPNSTSYIETFMNLGNISNLAVELKNPENFQGQLLLVNGEVEPTVEVGVGSWLRLKMINAFGGNQVISNFGFVGSAQKICELKVLAYDGVYLRAPRLQSSVLLASGGRADVAVRCSVAGTHRIASIDAVVPPYGSLGGQMPANLTALILNVAQQSSIQVDLPNILPGPPVYYTDLVQTPEADIDGRNTIMLSNFPGENIVNGWPYNGSVSYDMPIGSLQEWRLIGGQGPMPLGSVHPYHQHVTHFQILESSLDTNGLVGMVGDYRDTVPLYLAMNFTVRFKAAIGGIMMIHCHVLRHEDLGMMTLANITTSSASVPAVAGKKKFLHP